MLIRVEPDGADLDAPPEDAAWNASRHERFVRLLSETGVPAGLLCTDDRIRLIYAPGGETPGYLTFDFSQMAMPAGRPILAAFDMLLSAHAMFVNEEQARCPRCSPGAARRRPRSRRGSRAKCWPRCTSCCAGSWPRTRATAP